MSPLNVFNRLLALALALALIAAGGYLLAGVAGVVPAPVAAGPVVDLLAGRVNYQSASVMGWAASGGATAVAAGLTLLLLELRGPRRPRELVLTEDRQGAVTVSLPGLRRLATHVVSGLAGVEAVTADARPTRGGLVFRCHVSVAPDTSTPELAASIRETLGAAVERHLGMAPAGIHVHAQVASPAELKRRLR